MKTRRGVEQRRTLITGGAGFIGSNVAHRLLNSGERVLIFDKLSRAGVEKNLEWLTATHGDLVEVEIDDVRNYAHLKLAAREAGKVFHFAAQVAVTSSLDYPIDDFEINARGTLNLLEALRALPTPPPLVFTSTNKVYGALARTEVVKRGARYAASDDRLEASGISEEQSLDFCSPYGCSKGAADQYVLDYAHTFHMPCAVFRMSCIYGPRQFGNEDQGWLAHFIIQTLAGRPITIYGDGLQVRDVLFVDDLVDALLLAQEHMRNIAGEAFNIGGGPENTVSLLELLDLIRELNGGDCAIRFEPWRAADQRYYVSNTSKFRSATGWEPHIKVREGVRRLYQWLVSQSDASPRPLRSPAIAAPSMATRVST
jgi:CDP-paratose 2-epimerase